MGHAQSQYLSVEETGHILKNKTNKHHIFFTNQEISHGQLVFGGRIAI